MITVLNTVPLILRLQILGYHMEASFIHLVVKPEDEVIRSRDISPWFDFDVGLDGAEECIHVANSTRLTNPDKQTTFKKVTFLEEIRIFR